VSVLAGIHPIMVTGSMAAAAAGNVATLTTAAALAAAAAAAAVRGRCFASLSRNKKRRSLGGGAGSESHTASTSTLADFLRHENLMDSISTCACLIFFGARSRKSQSFSTESGILGGDKGPFCSGEGEKVEFDIVCIGN